jgi:hypothetical protein
MSGKFHRVSPTMTSMMISTINISSKPGESLIWLDHKSKLAKEFDGYVDVTLDTWWPYTGLR